MEKNIAIPADQQATFIKLVNLPIKDFSEIFELFKLFPRDEKPINFKNYLKEKEEYSEVLLGILFSYITFGRNSSYFLNILYKTYLNKIDAKEKSIPEDEFKSKFDIFFQSNNPVLVSLTKTVNSSLFEVVLVDTKIITDIRPIFIKDKDSEILSGSLITNQLRILYDDSDSSEEIYFYLDKSDLIDLKDSIETALKRIEFLERDLEQSKGLNPVK